MKMGQNADAFDFLLGEWEIAMLVMPEGSTVGRRTRSEAHRSWMGPRSSTKFVISMRQDKSTFAARASEPTCPTVTRGMWYVVWMMRTCKADDNITPGFGDNVTIRATPETERLDLAGRPGTVSGFTTPSFTGIEVIGAPLEDYAVAVMFENGPVRDAWFAADLVEFVDHAPGTEIRVGNIKAIRNADGTWTETRIDGTSVEPTPESPPVPRKRWWQFWSRG